MKQTALYLILLMTILYCKGYDKFVTVITFSNGEKTLLHNSSIQSMAFEAFDNVLAGNTQDNRYNWKYGGISAASGEIYSRSDRLYSELIHVHKGDVIKTKGNPFVIQFYSNDSIWVNSDYSTNGFRNRDYLITENGLIRLLVAQPDFTDFPKAECKVWVQRGGYERYISPAEKYPALFPKGKFGLQAHRGICDEYPEHTIPSFEAAARVEIYKGIETDVQMTSDGIIVCMHDNTIDRTTNGSGKVSDYTFNQLQSFFIDGGNGWSETYTNKLHIPTFEEYLDICKTYGKVPYVELKLISYEGIRKTVDLLHKKGFEDGTYVLTSFTRNYLIYASTICDAPLEFMASFTEEDISKNAHLKNIILRPQSAKVTKDFVKKCHEYDVMVECYGIPVGDNVLVGNLLSWGVEGGTCNSWKGLGLDK